MAILLDHFIGANEQCLRQVKAERLGGFEVDDHELGRLLDREIGRFFAFQDAIALRPRADICGANKNVR